ncbi:glucose-6-phosphate isomerase [Actinomadura rupiterrae]|uniref:glucose-6-phosphate isomerase n=1 Tax=Actinomadura rupiterrae TaxID=559627 RepID=UPI0020A3C1A8|nr:glucose-6-phosphate isomerase [Actinomadura rupiterrae]MCP2341260.1 glucose-6-phosphate isomerase [Actinomadura rupiterrae]
MTSVVTAAGVSVTIRGPLVDATESVLDRLVTDGVPGALQQRSARLWGPDAASDAARRLGWLRLPAASRDLLGPLAERVAAARAGGLTRVVLAGMGATPLAAEVAARAAAPAAADLVVLDTSDPQALPVALDEIHSTLLVVAGKGGASVETDAHLRIFEAAFREAGIDPAARIVAVTDPGSPLDGRYDTVHGDPETGGRFGALDAYGLVPSALAGADVERLLDEASALAGTLHQPYDNPALALGAALGASALAGRDKLVIADQGSGLPGLADWIAQLVAASTGKDGKGLLPVVVEDVGAPGFELAPDMRRAVLGGRPDEPGPAREAGLSVSGPLGAQFLLWEYAVAVAGRVLGVNPFNEPAVAESKDNTAALLRAAEGTAPTVIPSVPALVEDFVEVHAREELLQGAGSLSDALDALLEAVPDRGYLSVLAFLDRHEDASAGMLRPLLAERSARLRRSPVPVTFDWGPRYLHTSGQYHKGGPENGAFLVITAAPETDVAIPGRPYTLGELQLAQAFGDLRALRARGRPIVRLHLKLRTDGLNHLAKVLT